jgi:hypothetical protein
MPPCAETANACMSWESRAQAAMEASYGRRQTAFAVSVVAARSIAAAVLIARTTGLAGRGARLCFS